MIKLFISPFDSGQKGVLPVLDRECNVPVYIYTCLGQLQSYYMYLQDSFTGEHVHIYSVFYLQDLQMLLNMYCNDHMNHNDGTCCRVPDSITSIQIITAAFFLVWYVSYPFARF